MIRFVSTKGGVSPVDFETAVLQGYAEDGGLFVPESLPRISAQQLRQWSDLSFVDLAFEVLSLFIDRSLISAVELKQLLRNSFKPFEHPDVLPVVTLENRSGLHVMEMFHGPTLSFKDVAMEFLIGCLDFFLRKRGTRKSLLVVTTGDTGPAAAHASAGKSSVDCWTLYPRGMISEEQERQMTTLEAANVFAVGVENCPDGGDDIDLAVARMFADEELKNQLQLSSVNSINWCRVMVQTLPYFYGYFRTVDEVGQEVVFSVPSGAFGNLFGGYMARAMGLPVQTYICANNRNATLHRAFSSAIFAKKDLIQTVSSAIDIVVPYNFWRYLYFATGCNPDKIRDWMAEFKSAGSIQMDTRTAEAVRQGFISASISDEQTLSTIDTVYHKANGYLLDPHAAVAVAAAEKFIRCSRTAIKVICLATAHPAKFPDVIRKALTLDGKLPAPAMHKSIEAAKDLCQHLRLCDYIRLNTALVHTMKAHWQRCS
ncbi:MAG: threonine synthase [bacterium]|nr:threonine synthase [bacterium]